MKVIQGLTAMGLCFVTATLLVIGCNNANFTTGTGDGRVIPPSPTCTAKNVAAIVEPTKILFLVDTSGSNAQSTNNTCANGVGLCPDPATDPQKVFRYNAISNFVQTYQNKANFQWSFITFSNDSGRAFVNPGNPQLAVFVSNPSVMQTDLTVFKASTDFGDTPYRVAFNMAGQAIANDHAAASTDPNTNYFVIMLTDGYPTDYYSSGYQVQTDAVLSDVGQLINTVPGHVMLSTVYYGANDPLALGLLQSMANTGQGQFANVTSAYSTFTINDVIPGSYNGCP